MQYTGNMKKIEDQIRDLEERIDQELSIKKIDELVTTLYHLLIAYQLMTGIELENMKTWKRKLSQYLSNRISDKVYCKYYQSYMHNIDFHGVLAQKALSSIKDSFWFNTVEDKNADFDDKTAYELMYNFLKEMKDEKILEELIQKRNLFVIEGDINWEDFGGLLGLILNNSMTHDNYILLRRENPLIMMGTLIHEIGHIKDEINLKSQGKSTPITTYNRKSVYTEVFAKNYEKKFYYYLMDENIYPAKSLYFHYLSGYNQYSTLYRFYRMKDIKGAPIRNPWLLYGHIQTALSNGYGNMLADYFMELQKESPLIFQEKWNTFEENKTGFFNKRDLLLLEDDATKLTEKMAIAISKEKEMYQRVKQK